MKKRIMAFLCAALVTISSSMTVFAASPSADALIAPRIDLSIQSENALITPIEILKKIISVNDVKEDFELGVLEAIQECVGTDIRVLGVRTIKNIDKKAGKVITRPTAFSILGITSADNVKILAYNEALSTWEFLPVAVLDGEVYTVMDGHSHCVFMVDGQLPEEARFKAPKTEQMIGNLLAASTASEELNGGKDASTAIELSADVLDAPFTADTDMTLIMVAAAAFAVVMAGTGKKLIACEN